MHSIRGAWQVTMVMYDIVTVVFVYVACYNNNGWLSSWTVCCTILLVFVHTRQAGVCIHTTIHWYSTCTRVIQILDDNSKESKEL